jgi:O-antigen ligase
LFLFIFTTITTELINQNNNSINDLLKFISYFFIYISGRIIPIKHTKNEILKLISFFSLFTFFTLSFSNFGYKIWGSVYTFTGGYFFKTDMAISSLILFTIILSLFTNRLLLIIAFLINFYIIFKTNARIALPLTIIIPSIFYAINKKLYFDKKIIIFSTLFILPISLALFIFVDSLTINYLTFDFQNPFSVANTQGRTVIWESILYNYLNSDLSQYFFGMGLGADIISTEMYATSNQLAGVRAHSSYLYLLVSTGIIGSILFYYFLYFSLKNTYISLKYNINKNNYLQKVNLNIIIIFLFLSLSTEAIIRPQIMFFIFFLSGITIQSNFNYKYKQLIN